MITQTELKKILKYNHNTGIFTRRVSRFGNYAGSIAGCKDRYGYIQIGINGKIYKAHRLAWLYMYGIFPNTGLDHINRIVDDNRISNLRIANKSNNSFNSPGKKNTLGVKGVSKHWNKYVANAQLNGKRYYLGLHNTLEKAGEAYNKFAKKHHKEFYYNGSN